MLSGLVLDLLRIPPMRSFPSATSGVAIAQNLAQMLKFQKFFQLEIFLDRGIASGLPSYVLQSEVRIFPTLPTNGGLGNPPRVLIRSCR